MSIVASPLLGIVLQNTFDIDHFEVDALTWISVVWMYNEEQVTYDPINIFYIKYLIFILYMFVYLFIITAFNEYIVIPHPVVVFFKFLN